MKYHDRRVGKLVDPSKSPREQAGEPTAKNPRVPDMNSALLNMMQNKSVFGGELHPGGRNFLKPINAAESQSGSSSG